MDNDPNVLVALGAGSIAHRLLSGMENRRDACSLTISTSHGITTDNNTNIRTFPILDAIASLSVADASAQVVAVAMQVDFSKPTVVLTVAENGPVQAKVLAHVANMWRLLGIISNRYDLLRLEDRAVFDSTEVPDSTPAPSPPIPANHDIEPWRAEFMETVYRYSILKTLTRFDKWWGKLVRFVTLFEAHDVSDEFGLKERFIDAVYVISESRPTLEKIRSNTHIPALEWKELIYAMDATIPDVLEILSNENACETWAKAIQGAVISPFRLRRAIEKLTTQHRHIHVLLRFAHSPRLRPAFLTPLSVVPIPTPPRVPISLPATPMHWKSLIETVCNGHVMTSDQWLTDEAMKLHAQFPGGRYSGVVHCECALIAHFETTHRDPPPFSYIGVSKLSCRGCQAWIQAFNAAGGRQYHTQGSHGKWYFPWAMPGRGAEKVSPSHVARTLREKYIKFWTSEGKLYSASDSSDASGKGGRAIIGKEVDDIRRDVLGRGRARGLLE